MQGDYDPEQTYDHPSRSYNPVQYVNMDTVVDSSGVPPSDLYQVCDYFLGIPVISWVFQQRQFARVLLCTPLAVTCTRHVTLSWRYNNENL